MNDKIDNGDASHDLNQVILRGRLAACAVVRELPSGTELCTFRLNVRRPDRDRTRVDSLECAASRAAARKVILRAAAGDILELTGRLHRRFWRGGAGIGSRYEVEVATARIIARRRSAASPSRRRVSA